MLRPDSMPTSSPTPPPTLRRGAVLAVSLVLVATAFAACGDDPPENTIIPLPDTSADVDTPDVPTDEGPSTDEGGGDIGTDEGDTTPDVTEEVEVTDEQVAAETAERSDDEDPRAAEFWKSDDGQDAIRADLRERAALDLLKSRANITAQAPEEADSQPADDQAETSDDAPEAVEDTGDAEANDE